MRGASPLIRQCRLSLRVVNTRRVLRLVAQNKFLHLIFSPSAADASLLIMRPPPFYDSIFYPYVPPHSRKASLATPRKFLRGVCVCACGCVYASQKYGRSPRSSFLCVAPELSRCSLIFAPRDGGYCRHLRVSDLGHVRQVRSLILALKMTHTGSP